MMKVVTVIVGVLFCNLQVTAQLKRDTLVLRNNTNLIIVDSNKTPICNFIYEDSLINCIVLNNLKRLSHRTPKNAVSFNELFIEEIDSYKYIGSSDGKKLNGYMITYDSLKIESIKENKNDSNSTLRITFENEKIKEIYKLSREDFDDFFVEFYNGKSIKTVGNYKNGCRIGEWRTYYDNGVLKEIGSYCDCLLFKLNPGRLLTIVNKEGIDAEDKFAESVISERLNTNIHAYHLKDGIWSYYNANGILNYSEEYKRGEKIK